MFAVTIQSPRLFPASAFAVFAALLLSSAGLPSLAQGTHLWSQSRFEEFEKGTPQGIVSKLNTQTQRIFDDPGFREKFLAPNFIFPIVSPPEAFAERIRLESAKWGKVIRDANIKAE